MNNLTLNQVVNLARLSASALTSYRKSQGDDDGRLEVAVVAYTVDMAAHLIKTRLAGIQELTGLTLVPYSPFKSERSLRGRVRVLVIQESSLFTLPESHKLTYIWSLMSASQAINLLYGELTEAKSLLVTCGDWKLA